MKKNELYVSAPYEEDIEVTWIDWALYLAPIVIRVLLVLGSAAICVSSYINSCFDGLTLLGVAGLFVGLILWPLAKKDAR